MTQVIQTVQMTQITLVMERWNMVTKLSKKSGTASREPEWSLVRGWPQFTIASSGEGDVVVDAPVTSVAVLMGDGDDDDFDDEDDDSSFDDEEEEFAEEGEAEEDDEDFIEDEEEDEDGEFTEAEDDEEDDDF